MLEYIDSSCTVKQRTILIGMEKSMETISPKTYAEILETINEGIRMLDKQWNIIYANQALCTLLGYDRNELIGMSVFDLYPEKDRNKVKNLYADRMKGQSSRYESTFITKTGQSLHVEVAATPIFNDQGEFKGSFTIVHDITERKQFEAGLRKLSITDSLSGLFNHRHFHMVLADELSRARRYKRHLSLICFDLDHFKQFNDCLGHLEGDNIIRLVGQNLSVIMRSTDRSFRYGGDEFMILLPETTISNAYVSAEKLRKHFNANWPFTEVCWKSNLNQVTLSLGVAEADSQDKTDTLIKRADLAMYEAKRAGGNRTVAAAFTIGTANGLNFS